MLLNSSEPQFPKLLKDNNKSTYFKGILRKFKKLIYKVISKISNLQQLCNGQHWGCGPLTSLWSQLDIPLLRPRRAVQRNQPGTGSNSLESKPCSSPPHTGCESWGSPLHSVFEPRLQCEGGTPASGAVFLNWGTEGLFSPSDV